MYYLQSRYYDAKICRFINPDSVLANVGGNILGNNLYAYCFNNPVMYSDSEGNWPQWITNVVNWISDNIVNKVAGFVSDISEDIKNYDKSNTDESVVFSSNYFSCYNGTLVVLTSFESSFSFGVIALCRDQMNTTTLRHEYGHSVQYDKMGAWDYLTQVFAPSVAAYHLDTTGTEGKLPFDYYSSPWEHEADVLGGVDLSTAPGRTFSDPWTPDDGYFWDLIKLF